MITKAQRKRIEDTLADHYMEGIHDGGKFRKKPYVGMFRLEDVEAILRAELDKEEEPT